MKQKKEARHSLGQITVSGLHTSLDECESLPTLELNIDLNRKFVVENNWKAISDAWVNRTIKWGKEEKGESGGRIHWTGLPGRKEKEAVQGRKLDAFIR